MKKEAFSNNKDVSDHKDKHENVESVAKETLIKVR
jgi:hypothetical protein